MIRFDVEALRRRFPALSMTDDDGRPLVLFDGPGGTQVPDTVIEAVSRYYRESNANHGGAFTTSRRSDAIVEEAHVAVADLVGADADEVKFGANMTSLTLHVSRSITATMQPGDEIVVTTLDHDANVSPWRLAAADRGIRVRSVDIRDADCTLDLDRLDDALTPRTRLVAFGWASNAVGTINPVAEVVRRAHAVGAWTYVDAVHAAPHLPIDVRAVDTDFLACSVYKFFGPHLGALVGRRELLRRLPAYRVRPATDRFETGTGNFEAAAGTTAAIDYLAGVGQTYGTPEGGGRRAALRAAMAAIRVYELGLYRRLVDGLEAIPGLRLWGITDRDRFEDRTPTAAFTLDGHAPRAIAEALGRDGIAVWDGDFYATGLIERLGLAGTGGVVRVGLTHYNTAAEVDRLVDAVRTLAGAEAAIART
ncbi:MAG TPA: cysteine desulfurase-like protein [Candidatus Limnocylindrales bacterium]